MCSYCTADMRLCFTYANCWFSSAAANLKQGECGCLTVQALDARLEVESMIPTGAKLCP